MLSLRFGCLVRNLLLVLGLVVLVAPAWAQNVTFSARRSRDYNPNDNRGYCIIRVAIDDTADISVQGSQVNVRAIQGRAGRDAGSECSQPLPSHDIQDFRFEKMDGRGSASLIQQPAQSNNYTALMRVSDDEGGAATYDMRISWTAPAGGSSLPSSGTNTAAMNDLRFQTQGSGEIRRGSRRDPINSVDVDLKRDGNFEMTFRSGDQTHRLTGTWLGSSQNDVQLRVTDGLGFSGAEGQGAIRTSNNGRQLERIQLEGRTQLGGENFTLAFDAAGGSLGNTNPSAAWGGQDSTAASRNGRGTIDYDNREEVVQRVNVVLTNGGRQARLEAQLGSGQTMFFVGNVRSQTNQAVEIDLQDSNFGRLTGAARVEYGGTNEVNEMFVYGDASSGRLWMHFNAVQGGNRGNRGNRR